MTEHPAHDALRVYASGLEDEVSSAAVHRAVRRAMAAEPTRFRLRRTAVVLASALGFGLGNAALALAAQPSVPGDALYGVERAYEWVASLVGIQLGSPEERLDEAAILLERGDVAGARALVAEALGDAGAPGASEMVDSVPPESTSALVEGAKGVAEAAKTGDPEQVAEAVSDLQEELGPPGVPPGLETSPPGLGGEPPGQADEPPGQSGEPPGQAKKDEASSGNETPPGNSGGAGASRGSKGKGSAKKP